MSILVADVREGIEGWLPAPFYWPPQLSDLPVRDMLREGAGEEGLFPEGLLCSFFALDSGYVEWIPLLSTDFLCGDHTQGECFTFPV
jgi:hypothetical protein